MHPRRRSTIRFDSFEGILIREPERDRHADGEKRSWCGLSVVLHNDASLAPFHPTPNGQAAIAAALK
jgi:hypothetical protein